MDFLPNRLGALPLGLQTCRLLQPQESHDNKELQLQHAHHHGKQMEELTPTACHMTQQHVKQNNFFQSSQFVRLWGHRHQDASVFYHNKILRLLFMTET